MSQRLDPRVARAAHLNGLAYRALRRDRDQHGHGGYGFVEALPALLRSEVPISPVVREALAAAIESGRVAYVAVSEREKADRTATDRALVKYRAWRTVGEAKDASGLSWTRYWSENPTEDNKDEIEKFNAKLRKYLKTGRADGITLRGGLPLSDFGLTDIVRPVDPEHPDPITLQEFCWAYSRAAQRRERARPKT